MFEFATVILAAGASLRMGQPKLLLPWHNDTTVIGHLLQRWQQLGARQIALVCALDDRALGEELDRLGFPSSQRILNPEPSRGMFSSVQCAASWQGWLPGLTHWVLALGDQPHLSSHTLRLLLNYARAHPESICQPGRNQRPRHPVVFPAEPWRRLAGARQGTLKEYLQENAALGCVMEIDDAGLDLDIDLPSDYRKALALALGPRP